jgi:hypothetical protein
MKIEYFDKPSNKNFGDFTGKRFGRLIVQSYAGRSRFPSGCYKHFWNTKCDCGNEAVKSHIDLRSGDTQSCGCRKIDRIKEANTKHRQCYTPEYHSWAAAKSRCTNEKSKDFPNYGGRGIRMCDRWLNSFKNFFADMGPRPDGTSIDRIDNDGNYEPGNCQWASRVQQNRNQRKKIIPQRQPNGTFKGRFSEPEQMGEAAE